MVGRTEREEYNALMAIAPSLREVLRMRVFTISQVESYNDQITRQCSASEHAYAQLSAQMSNSQTDSRRLVTELENKVSPSGTRKRQCIAMYKR